MRYEHIIQAVVRVPWAIMREKLEDVMAVIDRGVRGVQLTPDQIEAAVGASARDVEARTAFNMSLPQSVKVIPVYGVIAPRGAALNSSGVTSAEALTKEIQVAAAAPNVSEIVLDVNSPGGSVMGLQEVSAAIQAAKREKPVYAIANPLMASAAYWLGAQASELWMTPDALVGSIGVYSVHIDQSEALAKAGIKVTFVSAGKHKVAGNQTEELSEESLAEMQGFVDEHYGQFVKAVAKGRGVTPSTVKNGMGEGRVVMVKEALSENMVDKTGTLQALLGFLGVSGGRRSRQNLAEQRELDLQALGRQVDLNSELPDEEPEGSEPDIEKTDKEIEE